MEKLLAYASYRVIQRFGDPASGAVEGLWFNKVMSLLDRRLKKKQGKYHEGLRLPHCWYFWGDLVVLRHGHMPSELRLETPGIVDGRRSRFRWIGDAPEDPPSKDRKVINSLVESLRSLYPKDEKGLWKIVDDVYSYAPYEFQRLYAAFRTDYHERVDPQMKALQRTLLRADLKDAMASFPSKEFPELVVEATATQILADALLAENDEAATRLAIKVARAFWEEAFCPVLITTEKGHGNVSDQIVDEWKDEAISRLAQFNEDSQRLADTAVSSFKLKALDGNPVTRTFIFPDRWGAGTEESSLVDTSAYR
jgi:hypothetical protein